MTVFRIGHDWDLSVVLLQDPRRIQAGTSGRLRLVLFGLLWFALVWFGPGMHAGRKSRA